MIVIMVAIGGAAGSVMRYVLTLICSLYFGLSFPYGTLLVNVIGSFLIGLAMAFFDIHTQIPSCWKACSIAGFLGGFTTFSSFSFDNFVFLEQQAYITAFLNILLNTGLALIAVFVGYYLVKG